VSRRPATLRRLPRPSELDRLALPGLRICLGLVFVWFGGLELAGRSPVADLLISAALVLLAAAPRRDRAAAAGNPSSTLATRAR
jgi:hypothetical protein